VSLADSRKKQQSQNHAGRVLGGDNAFTQWMTPKEAAVAAADARRRQEQMRRRGELCCRPCLEENDSDEQNDADDRSKLPANIGIVGETGDKKRPNATNVLEDVENRKPRAKTKDTADWKPSSKSTGTSVIDIIDLTGDDDYDDNGQRHAPRRDIPKTWPCGKCTFLNPPVVAACSMCLTERDWNTLY
jgi:hypothetical protein